MVKNAVSVFALPIRMSRMRMERGNREWKEDLRRVEVLKERRMDNWRHRAEVVWWAQSQRAAARPWRLPTSWPLRQPNWISLPWEQFVSSGDMFWIRIYARGPVRGAVVVVSHIAARAFHVNYVWSTTQNGLPSVEQSGTFYLNPSVT